LNALKLPKNTEDEQNARNKVIASALIECSKIPLSIAETCIEILELAKKCYQVGNKNVLTDVKVGVNLAIAAGKSALEPIEMNLNSIKDENIKSELLTNKENILTILEKFVL
jgi:formiminotetrahydrofolate cyclodeaminase